MAGDGSRGNPRRPPPAPSPQALAEQYRAAASRQHLAMRRPDMAEHIDREHEDTYYRLRRTSTGRQAISSLLGDPDDAVRIWAAIHSMEWSPGPARAVLEQAADERSPFAVVALWALRSAQAGQLLATLGVRGWDGRWRQPPIPEEE